MPRLLLLTLFLFVQALGQTPEVDAVRATLTGLQGRARLAALVEAVNRIETRAPREAVAMAAEGLVLARQFGDREKEAALLSSTAFCYSQTGDFALSVENGLASLELARQIQNRERIARAHNTLGITYTFMGLYSEALAQHLDSLRIREELSLDTASIQSMNNIGVLYHNMGQYQKALDYFQKILQRLSGQPDSSRLILVKLNIGFAQYKLGRLAEALKNHNEALDLIAANHNDTMIAYAHLNLGLTYTDLKQYPKALGFLQLALSEYTARDQKHGRLQVLNALGRLHRLAGSPRQAIASAEEAVALAERINARNELMVGYRLLADIYADQRDPVRSYAYFRRYAASHDLIYSSQEGNRIANLNMDIVTLRKDHEIDTLKKERTISRLRLEKLRDSTAALLTALGLVLLAILAFLQYNRRLRRHRATLEAAHQELERLNRDLHDSIDQIKILGGLLPICTHCKKIRNDSGYWQQLETYISQHSSATFSHGICPTCSETLYPPNSRLPV